ncbi:MAG TPA: MFS transporter [Cytophagaceae bacterium]|nr:MFS transporter [Cytophagaceae bacterium]
MSITDPYAVIRIPDFRYFITARIFVTMAVQMQGVIVGWQIYSLTKDPFALGIIGLAEALPALTVALYAGHLADSQNRKAIITTAYTVLFLCFCTLAFLSSDLSLHSESTRITGIYSVVFVTGLARGFLNPAMFGLLTQCVPSSLYPQSSAWNSSLLQISIVAGAALSGIIYSLVGFTVSYLIDAGMMLVGIFSIASIAPKARPVLVKGQKLSESLLSGIKFVFSHQVFLGALAMDLFAVLFGGAVALLPIFAEEILHTGPQGLGMLRAAPSIGASLMAVYQIYHPPMRNSGRTLLLCVSGFGVCMILFALSSNFYLSLLVLAVSGAFDNVSVVIRSIIMQTLTPEGMKGRVSSVNSMFIGSSNEIGEFESGVAAKIFGVIPSVIIGGCMTLLVVGITAVKAPLLRTLDLGKKEA